MIAEQSHIDYQRVAKAIRYIKEQQPHQPSMEEIAAYIHLSPYHFQRLFTRWAGISPKKFLQYLTLRYAREHLSHQLTLTEVADKTGLSGTGRLHDLFITMEGMTPDEYRKSGAGRTIYYGFHQSTLWSDTCWHLLRKTKYCSLQFFVGRNHSD